MATTARREVLEENARIIADLKARLAEARTLPENYRNNKCYTLSRALHLRQMAHGCLRRAERFEREVNLQVTTIWEAE